MTSSEQKTFSNCTTTTTTVMEEVRGVVLAAGRGRRMGDATDNSPKCLQTVHGRPLLEHVLDAFRQSGIHKVAIVTGYRAQDIRNRVDVTFHNEKWETTNMVSSLTAADEWLSAYPCIISYSDIFYEPQAVSLLQEALLLSGRSELTVLYDPRWLELWEKRFVDPLVDAETFRMSDKNEVIEIGGKPSSLDEIEGQFMGLWSVTPKIWQTLMDLLLTLPNPLQRSIDTTALIQRWIDNDCGVVRAIRYMGMWGEVDRAEDLAVYERLKSSVTTMSDMD